MSFADDQAKKTGENKRTIQRNAERGEKIAPAALEMLKGTRLDKGSYLDSLKGLTPEQQCAKVKRDLAKAQKPPRKAKTIDPEEASERRIQAAKNAVSKLSKDELAIFAVWFEEHFDTPIFDAAGNE